MSTSSSVPMPKTVMVLPGFTSIQSVDGETWKRRSGCRRELDPSCRVSRPTIITSLGGGTNLRYGPEFGHGDAGAIPTCHRRKKGGVGRLLPSDQIDERASLGAAPTRSHAEPVRARFVSRILGSSAAQSYPSTVSGCDREWFGYLLQSLKTEDLPTGLDTFRIALSCVANVAAAAPFFLGLSWVSLSLSWC